MFLLRPGHIRQLILSPTEKFASVVTPSGPPTVTITPAGLRVTASEYNPLMIQIQAEGQPPAETTAYALEATLMGRSDQSHIDAPDSRFTGADTIMLVIDEEPRGILFGDAGLIPIPEPDPVAPAPVLTSIEPNSVALTDQPSTIRVLGSDFPQSSEVTVSGVTQITSWVSASELSAQVSGFDTAGTYPLTVRVSGIDTVPVTLTFT